jgi:DNA binding domain protein, excisionase family
MAVKTASLITVEASSLDSQSLEALARTAQGLPQDDPLAILLENLIVSLENGADVAALRLDQPLTPTQAAKALCMSRPSVYKLMDRGLLAFHYVGKDRRIPTPEVLDYIKRREEASAQMAYDLAHKEEMLQAAVNEEAPLSPQALKDLEDLEPSS